MPIWLIQIVVGIVLSVASTLIEQAWGPKANTGAASGYSADLKTGGGSAQYFIIGTWATAGKLEYANTWGSDGDTPNAYLVYVISLGDLPVTALTGAYEAGEAITVGTGTHATQGYPIPERRNGSADRFWVEFHDGSQTTANSYLTGKFGSDASKPWLSDMIGRGIPYVTTTALADRDVWNNTPQCMFQAKGIPLYDPRQDSTAGGSGSQRLADQSTWAFSDNLAVMIYNILVGIRYENTIIWGGRVSQGQLPYTNWAAAMDACDLAIDLAGGGTEKQFRGGRQVKFSDKPADIISDFLVACNGRIAECAGVYTILVGAPAAAVATFTDADTIVTENATLDPFPNLDNLVNGAVATYAEPTQAWATKETTPYAPSDLVAADRGQVLTANIDLTNSVFSGTQAQRIERAAVLEGRRFLKHVVPLRPVWGNYRPLETLAWNSDHNQYSGKSFLVTAWTEEANGNVIFGLQEVDPTDHAWSTSDEGALTFTPLLPIKPAAQIIADFAVFATTFNDADGNARRPGIAATWGSGQVDVRAVLVAVRVKATAAIEWSGEIDYATFPSGGTLPHAFLPAVEYEVQGVYVPFSARPMTASAWLTVTTTDTLFTGADIAEATIAASKLEQDIQNLLGNVLPDMQADQIDLRDLLGEIAENVADLTATTQQIKQVLAVKSNAQGAQIVITQQVSIENQQSIAEIDTQLDAVNDDLAAEVSARQSAVAGVSEAVATLTATVAANYQQLSAGGVLSWQASAGADGVSTSVTMVVTASDGHTQVTAGTYTKIISNGAGGFTSQTISIADKQYWASSDGSSLSLPMIYNATSGRLTVNELDVNKVSSISGKLVIDGTTANSFGEEYIQVG